MGSERPHPESVSVELSGCDRHDAQIVFDTLGAYFTSDRRSGDVPEASSGARPTVWLGTFDVADPREGGARPEATARLGASVDADLQGGYWAVDRVRTTLESLFTVHDLSTVSGDQEKELHVRLESR
ncbi:hypothetical protein [Streptomyces prasinopilosus]|uniref:Uncharacterized protein n=1 Tax=Streptomyces prasinopilosus TaxID=67344 RepID=A0A1G6SHL7_9ACTN|nr:hypothetical protein [Streptomyces prasinopilosus]SDD15646.1 hypothetical protein SAMN05216505_105315 [Streptomyces prasinopilosus]